MKVISEVSFSSMAYAKIDDAMYGQIGRVIYRGAELELLVARLSVHLATRRDGGTLEAFDRAYEKYVGASGVVNTAREFVKSQLAPSDVAGIKPILDRAQQAIELRHAIAHGVPRSSGGDLTFFRKATPKRGQAAHEQHVAFVVSDGGIEALAQELLDVHRMLMPIVMYYWPQCQGEPPVKAERAQVGAAVLDQHLSDLSTGATRHESQSPASS